MTLEELASKLGELDEIRRHAERELAALKNYQEHITELEADRDTLLEYVETVIPERLDNLTGERRNKVYRMLRLEVKPTPNGFEITGAILHKRTDAFSSTDLNILLVCRCSMMLSAVAGPTSGSSSSSSTSAVLMFISSEPCASCSTSSSEAL